ncbi:MULTISPECIES: acetate--CoA ligase family protein [Achromobacter]|uniref:Acetate--CoA ligase family protein n=1 Tax=Achromobacter spanius TaxID=217203 RepID=A0ABY8GSE3_9BURK|nr:MULTISPECIES: acetate--CoA ligase family protein [Achromobacter]WAI83247.1 acetate--CoA ligase family protein [Achromobacter spanius]WEX93333.1 acetate--CoA ligase family protein [Achromobacter sp. SS2-2022]WFP07509.1 acetate--CoA ligase family protein [Achromobacter spanius]
MASVPTGDAGLARLLDPASIAIVGASDNPDKIGGRPIHYMRRHGYGGTLYPINPQRAEVQGERAWPSLAALPVAPDLAIVAVAGEQAVQAVDQCAELGVAAAIVISAGFSETGPAGRALQDAMTARARAAGLRIVGPNSQGLANFGNGAIASFSTMFLEVEPRDGPVAVISQSGGMCAMVYGLLRQRGIGVRHVHATGNEADVSVSELACATLRDPEVGIVLLYLESLREAGPLAQAAAMARARGVPLMVVKAGRSEAGARAAASHTGALANEDRAVDAFLEHHGILRARDPQELVRYAELALRSPLPQGPRVVVVSNSGASCVLASDAAADRGLDIAPLSIATQQALAERLPGFATTVNPVDITAALLSNNGLFGQVLPVIGADPAADMFLLDIPVAGRGYDVDSFAVDAADFAQAASKPVTVVAWQENVAQVFRARGLPVYADEMQAMDAMAALFRLRQLRERGDAAAPAAPQGQIASDPAPGVAGGFLSEAESLALLAQAGLAVIEHAVCGNADEAVAAWRRMGAPVALKACSKKLPHKSEHGLVALGLNDEAALRTALSQQAQTLASLGVRDGVWLVARMQRGLHECALGARMDPVLGPVVMIGSGGKYVEALQDVAVLMPPFDADQVIDKLRGLRIGTLLQGVRGDPPGDIPALAAQAVALGRYVLSAGSRLASIDINPVLVGAMGQGAVALDALVEVNGSGLPAPGLAA